MLTLAAAPPPDSKSLDQIWSESKHFFEPAGIDRHMFDVANHWIELQYVLGFCQPYLKDSDFLYWREWWKGTALERSDVGRRLLLTGDSVFNNGVRGRSGDPKPSAELCQRTADDWFRDMKATVDAGRKVPLQQQKP